jgi:hypothetical protein
MDYLSFCVDWLNLRAPLLYFPLFIVAACVCALCVYIKSGPNQILLAGIIVNKWKVVLIAMGCWAKNNSLISSIYSAERLLPVSERIFWCDCNWSARERAREKKRSRRRDQGRDWFPVWLHMTRAQATTSYCSTCDQYQLMNTAKLKM